MSEATTIALPAWGHRAVRLIVLSNFLLVGLFLALDRVGGSTLDAALRRTGLDSVVAWGVQVWIVGSTLFATGVFLRRLVKSRGATAPGDRPKGMVLDALFLFSWWVTLLAICAYAFALGLAG